MNVMDEWVAVACAELGLDPGDAQTKVVLDLARDVAHNVLRPGAPVSAYLLGVAVGRGADPAAAAARLSALAAGWPTRSAPPQPSPAPDGP
jgi:hypothetical protein